MEPFNEESLRKDIEKVWGPAGAHMDLYLTILRRAQLLEKKLDPSNEEFEKMSVVDRLQLITDNMKSKLDKHIHMLRDQSRSIEAIENHYFSIIDIFANRAKNVFVSKPKLFEANGVAALKIAALAKKIVETNYFQFRKRYLLEKEIREIAKKHNIKYP